MTTEEIRAQIASMGELPQKVESERYEDSQQFVGPMGGAKVATPTSGALAMLEALGEVEPGNGCGCSNCSC